MLVSCTTGGGNLLLNFGPRPDGTFAEGEAKVARAMGAWLKTHGDAIYGTRGGPLRNGPWGGSCHKGNKIFLHVYQWPAGDLAFDPLPFKVQAARTLQDKAVRFAQTADGFSVNVAQADREDPVTVIELTLDGPVPDGTSVGGARVAPERLAEYGGLLSEGATLAMSSDSSHDRDADHARLFKGERPSRGYAFHTGDEKNPWATVDLGAPKNVKAVVIENRPGEKRTAGLVVSASEDGQTWTRIWQAKSWEQKWLVPVTHFESGIDAPGRRMRHLKFETQGDTPRPMLLQRVEVYGE